MFYIEKDGKIIIFNKNKQTIINTIEQLPEYKDLEIKETNRPIENFEFTDTIEWAEKQIKKEKERILKLTMTALDFINVIKSTGVTDEQIEEFLNSNLNIKHQLQFCQNVYCGVAKSLFPITIGNIIITPEMVEQAFIQKHNNQ